MATNPAVLTDQDATAVVTKDNAEVNVNAGNAGDTANPQATANDGETKPEEHKRPGGFQRKITRLEEENRILLDALTRRAGETKTTDKPTVAQEEPEPEESDFPTVGEYLKAVRAYDAKQLDKRVAAKLAEHEQSKSAKTEHQKVVENFQQRQAAAREKYADYDETLSEDVPVTPAMEKVLLKSEHGAELAYWLGKNPEKAVEIAKLDAADAAFELGKIEARLAKDEPAPEQVTEPAPISKAPTPINPIRKTAPVGKAFDPRDPKGDYTTFEKEMNKKQFGK